MKVEETVKAVKYMISVWDEVQGNWREKPDHVQQMFLKAEAEQYASSLSPSAPNPVNLTPGEEIFKKRLKAVSEECPNCYSLDVGIFDSKNDLCNHCGVSFPCKTYVNSKEGEGKQWVILPSYKESKIERDVQGQEEYSEINNDKYHFRFGWNCCFKWLRSEIENQLKNK